jgi:hypothetical protein
MSGEYQRAIREAIPDAEICFDPFHVCRLASRATDQVRRDEWNAHERSHTRTGRWVKGTRWSLLKAPERQTVNQLATLYEVQQANRALYRAFLLREQLRLLYHLDDPRLAPAHLDTWLAWASRSRLKPFVRLARTLRAHRRHPRRDPPRPHQRPPRGPQQQDPADQPPQLRLPLRRRPDRPRLPLLHRHHGRTAAMNFTHNSTGAPEFVPSAQGEGAHPVARARRDSAHGNTAREARHPRRCQSSGARGGCPAVTG